MSGPEELTPAEARARDLLAQLRGAPTVTTGTALAHRVVRTARWQRVVRGALAGAGHVLGALGEGVATLLRRRA